MIKPFPANVEAFIVSCLICFWKQIYKDDPSVNIDEFACQVSIGEVIRSLEGDYAADRRWSFIKTLREWSLVQASIVLGRIDGFQITPVSLVDDGAAYDWLDNAIETTNKWYKTNLQFSLRDAKLIQDTVWYHLKKINF